MLIRWNAVSKCTRYWVVSKPLSPAGICWIGAQPFLHGAVASRAWCFSSSLPGATGPPGWRGSSTDAVPALALHDSAPQQHQAARWHKGLVKMLIPEDVLTSGLMGCNDVLLSNDLAAGSLLLSWELGIFFQGWTPSFKGDGTWSVFSACWEKGMQVGFATASLGQNVAGRRLFAWNCSAGGPGQLPSFLGWPLPFQPGRGQWTNGWICATSTTLVSTPSHRAAVCYLLSVIFAAPRKWLKVCSLALW